MGRSTSVAVPTLDDGRQAGSPIVGTPPGRTRPVSRPATGGRLRSVDVTRGLVVGLSAVLSHIPDPSYTFARHAEWDGLQLLDVILPAFLTVFGVSIALAYRRGVRWSRLARRTALLVMMGLAFNAVVAWNPDPAVLRFTGVLQLFAVVGLIVTALTRIATRWWQALAVAVVVLVAVQVATLAVGADCAGGLPQPGCAPSTILDAAVVAEPNLYRAFADGYDPEGLPVMAGAVATVLLGYAAGDLLWRRRDRATAALFGLGVVALAAAPVFATALPINKRLWTPSFALVTAAGTILLLAVLHLVVDRLPQRLPRTAPVVSAATWLPEAFGRNSLLLYFGKYLVAAVLANVVVAGVAGDQSIGTWLYGWLDVRSARPALAYAAIMFTAWAAVAAALHRRGHYLRV